MSVIEKIEKLEKKYANQKRMSLQKGELLQLFGEDFEEKVVKFSSSVSYVPFEKEQELYYVALSEEDTEQFSFLVNTHTNLKYTKASDHFILDLVYRKKALEGNSIPYVPYRQKEIERIEKLLEHPSLRLKYLFMKNKR